MEEAQDQALEPWHGTLNGYTNHKCRCELCTEIQRAYRKAYHEKNKERDAATTKAWYEKNKDARREWQREYDNGRRELKKAQRFGLTVDELRTLLENPTCEICKSDDHKGNGWHIDHDHKCCSKNGRSCGKCIRGLLCHKCNVGLGHFDDDPLLLEEAARYIRKN